MNQKYSIVRYYSHDGEEKIFTTLNDAMSYCENYLHLGQNSTVYDDIQQLHLIDGERSYENDWYEGTWKRT